MDYKPPWEVLGEQFLAQYYLAFDQNRESALALYHSTDALFTFEGSCAQGVPAIKEILTTKLQFKKIEHLVTKVDCQPTSENGVIVLVTGRLKTDNDPAHNFSQMFYLKPVNGAFFIFNDIFRLSLHNSL